MRKWLVFTILVTFPFTSGFAQLFAGSAYLQGDHLEVGIAPCGAYGTPNAPPALGAAGGSYHPTETGLGFVADSDMDGWAVGSPPHCGDYFLPGSPVEGFVMSIGGTRYSNSSGFGICGIQDIPGALSDYRSVDTLSITWSGSHPDGFDLSIRTCFPKDKRYFIGEVEILNTSGARLDDIYFSRQVDPDPDQAWGGGFPTLNEILSQPGPGNPDALVTATGSLGCFVGLGARHFASRVSRGGFFIMDAVDPYCGNDPYALDSALTADDAIGVNFYFAKLEAGQSLSFSYAYILDPDELEEALEATATPVLVADGVPLDAPGSTGLPSVTVCPGDSLLLEIQGGDHFDWDWSPAADFASATGLSVYLKPEVSGDYAVSSSVPCGDDIRFEFSVIVDDPTGLLQTVDTAVCPGAVLQLSQGMLPPGASLLWEPPLFLDDPTAVEPTAQLDTAGASLSWMVTATSAAGCTAADYVHVVVYPEGLIDAGPDVTAFIGEEVVLQASGGSDYSWFPAAPLSDPNSAHPSLTLIDTIVFSLQGLDVNGCPASDEVTLTAVEKSGFVLPNAFSPNGDGIHDCYRIVLGNEMEFSDIRIFNRWAETVFQSGDIHTCWDGSWNGRDQELGSYIVVVRLLDKEGRQVVKTTSLTLIR